MSGIISGNYTGGVTLSANPTTIASGAEVGNTNDAGIAVTGPAGTTWVLTNYGSVTESRAGSVIGISFADSGTITNVGTISVDAATANSAGVYLGGGGSLINQSGGTIGGYFGVRASGAATVMNSGVIDGNYSSQSDGADGVDLSAGGSVTNQPGGTIYGHNDGVSISGGLGTVLNLGMIQSFDGAFGESGISLDAGGIITNGASGGTASTATIIGYHYAVQFGASGTDTLVNYGTIDGHPGTEAVTLATGTLINGPSGATGAVIESGDQTSAVLISGAATVANNGSIVGSEFYGDTLVFYGISLGGSGSITSSVSNLGSKSLITNYVAVYAAQNATVTNAGTMSAVMTHGGTANNAVIFGGGTNRLIVDPGAVFIGTVHGSGAVTLTPTIGSSTTLGITNGVGTTTLELASGASAGTLSGLGVQYVGFAGVTVDSSANWMVNGSSTLAAGTRLTNSGTLTDAGALNNYGSIVGIGGVGNGGNGNAGIRVSGGSLSNQATISGGSGAGSTSRGSGGSGAVGVSLISGSVTNQATINGGGGGGGINTYHGGAGGTGILVQGGGLTNATSGRIVGGSGGYGGYPGGGSETGGVGGAGIRVTAGSLRITNQGTIIGGAGGSAGLYPAGASGDGVYFQSGGTLTDSGLISGGIGNGVTAAAVSFGAGTSRLILDPAASFKGAVIATSSVTSVMELLSAGSAGTLAGLGSAISNFSSLVFDSGAQWTVAGNKGASGLANLGIGGFTVNDTIELTGVVANAGTYGGGVLTLTSAGTTEATMHIHGSFTTSGFNVANSSGNTFITVSTACYRAGTRILTPSGEVAIEALAIGDLVVTRSGEARPIKWIGRRSYAGRFIAGNRDVLPIRFDAGSIADGVPCRELDVSPKHAMFIDDVLIPAELLVNDASIRQLEDVESVEYWHLEFASHDVITANGAAAESFVDCDSRAMFHNAAEYARRYPGDPGPSWAFCAPRMEPASGELVAVRARLAGRAGLVEGFGPPEALLGHIDACDRTRMHGWIFDPAQPRQSVRLEVWLDGEVVGHVIANSQRPDLERVCGAGNVRHGFNLTHPIHLNPLASHVVELRRAADGAAIPGSPVQLPAASSFDAECRAGLGKMLLDIAEAATQPAELDAMILHQVAQVEALLAVRARLDTGECGDAAGALERWGGLVPTTAVRQAATDLRPRALFVDELFPAAGVSGGANAAIDHMRALGRIGFDVSFVSSQDLGDRAGRAEALAALGVRVLVAPWYGSVEEVLRRHAGRFDAVYLHRAGSASAYGKLVRQYCPRAWLVYGVADLHHVRLVRQGAVEGRPDVSALAARLRIEELMAARWADVVITHSAAEAALLRAEVPGASVAVVPWAVPMRQARTGFAERDGVVFVGHFGHEPNVDAVHWLAREIVPLVREREPGIQFRIVGHEVPESVQRLAGPGFEVVGAVERLDGVFDAARLSVAPLRYGAGIKAKVVESLAAGVPCVGTAIAFEGMGLPGALAGCVSDAPEGLAAAMVRLYRDERAHGSVAAAGQRWALVNHGEANVDALMRQALAPALRRWAAVGEFGHDDAGDAVAMRATG